MNQFLCYSIENKDWILLVLGLLATILWSLILFFWLLKPNLKINSFEVENKTIKIKVVNESRKRNAVNLKIEVCFICNGNTFHLIVDMEDFIILPPKDFRIFKMNALAPSAMGYGVNYEDLLNQLNEGNCSLRVRIHASHEYSGFGKAFEKIFKITNL